MKKYLALIIGAVIIVLANVLCYHVNQRPLQIMTQVVLALSTISIHFQLKTK